MSAIRVELELADGSFVTRMKHAGQTVKQFNDQVAASSPHLREMAAAGFNVVKSMDLADKRSKSFLGTMRDVSIVVGAVTLAFTKITNISRTWVGDIVRINSEFERLDYQMRSLSDAADPVADAADKVKYLRDMAQDAPFSLKTLNNAFVKLKATGTDPLSGALQSLTDGVAAFGGSDEQLNRVILGISQISGKGVIQMEELRQQLGEAMPTAVKIMARSMGVSMGQLIKEISTGTVAAEPALKSFYAELERTYGGRARYMMQTFEGQVKKTRTLLETLAMRAGEGGEGGGFFETLKDQVTELNELLGSKAGEEIASSIGAGLQSAVQWLRAGIDTVIEFREEIKNVAIVAGSAFALNAAVSGLSAFNDRLRSTAADVTILSTRFTQATATMNLAAIQWRSAGGAVAAFGTAARGLATGLGAVLAVGARLLPWMALAGTAVTFFGTKFGFFTDKVDNAYQALVRYGAETRKIAREGIADKVKQVQEDLAQASKELEQYEKILASGLSLDSEDLLQTKDFRDYHAKRVAELTKELKDIEDAKQAIIEDAGRREDEKAEREYRNELDALTQKHQRIYDAEMNSLAERRVAALDAAESTGESVNAIAERFAKEQQQIQLKLEEARIKSARDLQKRLSERLTGDLPDDLRAGLSVGLKVAEDQVTASLTRIGNIREAQLGKIQKLDAPSNGAKAFEKGEKQLANLLGKVADLRGEMSGVNGEIQKLEFMASNGTFGDPWVEQTRSLVKKLREATEAKEELDKIMKGRQDLMSDIDSAMDAAQEEALRIEIEKLGGEITEADKIRLKLQRGFYEGLGPNSPSTQAIRSIINSFDLIGGATNGVADALQKHAFGNKTISSIDTVNERLRETVGIITGLGSGLNVLDFDRLQTQGSQLLLSGSQFAPRAMPKAMEDKTAQVMGMFLSEGVSRKVAAAITGNFIKESSLNPTALGDNGTSFGMAQWRDPKPGQGRWTDLKQFSAMNGMSASDPTAQVKFALHEMRTKFPSLMEDMNRAPSVEAAAKLFMDKFERPNPKYANLPGRQQAAANAYSLGSGDVGPTVANSAYQSRIDQFEADQRAFQSRQEARLAELEEAERKNMAGAKDLKLDKLYKGMQADLRGLQENPMGDASIYEKTVAKIQDIYGKGVDLEDEKFAKVLEIARDLDRTTADVAEKKKAINAANGQEERLLERQRELTEKAAENQQKLLNPNAVGRSNAYRTLERETNDYVRNMETAHGRESEQYRQAVTFRTNLLRQQQNLEVSEFQAAQAKKNQSRMQSAMNETQARQFSIQQEIATIDQMVAQFQGSEEEKVRIVEWAEQEKAKIRQHYAAQSPMSKQMQEWSDLQGNLAKASTQWMDSLAGGLTDLIMGTGDLKSRLMNLARSMLNIGIKYMFSQMMQGKQMAGMQGGKGAKGAVGKGATGGKSGLFGIAHTGGIIGRSNLSTKRANPAAFIGAPKFHTGGIIGGPKLASDEVPIIARKGEGVFTPEQMASMGGMQQTNMSVTVSAPISIEGSGGSAEQNNDLAKKVGKQMEHTVRGVVVEEMRKQMRPGNMLNPTGRK